MKELIEYFFYRLFTSKCFDRACKVIVICAIIYLATILGEIIYRQL